jgi:hypothetical protein
LELHDARIERDDEWRELHVRHSLVAEVQRPVCAI